MDQHLHRPPVFFRPPPCENFVGRMPWGSPAHPLMKKYRPPFLRPPFGTSPEGLRFLPSHMQAPPMFGPRGATVPPHLMPQNNQKGNFRMNSCHNRMDNEVSDKEFWCETCDRSFNSKEMLFKHNSEHQKCGIDGCSFTAHANVVTKHIEMQHKTGLYDKIRNINTPEDISNWLKERKKNYPTKENIEKQKEQRKECFDRGEKLGENKSRFNNRSNNGRNNKNSRFQDRRNKFRDNKRKGPYSVVDSPETQSSSGTHNKCPNNNGTPKGKRMLAQDKITPKKSLPIQEGLQSDQNQMYCNLKPFQGISELVRNDLINDNQVIPVADDLDIEDDEWQELETKKLNIEKKASVCNALSNLINAYDSSDDESENMTSNSLNLKHQSNIQIKNIESTTKTKIILENTKASSNILESKIIDNLNEVKSNSGDSALTNIEKTLDIVSDDSGPDEIKTVKNCDDSLLPTDSVSTNIPSTSNNKRIRKRKHSNANAETIEKKLNNGDGTKISQNIPPKVVQKPFFKKKIPKTLLEKLLENDIKRERNMILQCVNYVVKNNFFKQSLDK